MTKEQQIDLTLLLATFRAFNEQLYNLKGTHSRVVKLKFNRLLKVSGQYEKEIIKWMDGSDELEAVYDALMDVLIEVKSNIDGQK